MSKAEKSTTEKNDTRHPLNKPVIEKITVNIGVGEAGERLKKAETVLQAITHQKPIQTLSKTTNKDFALRKRMPIGCKVTLRGASAHDFLKRALETRENKIADYSFDDQGNISFGVPDHTLFKDQKYNPDIGIFGMDISVTMGKPGYRIKRRRVQRRKIHRSHELKPEETMQFFSEAFQVEVVE
ncbi:MAG: 50S ribosomal protein L5 [Thermoplasmatota archaeon]